MAVTLVESTTQAPLDPAAVATLRGQLGGKLFLPGEPDYDDTRRVWNGMIDKHPLLIARASGVADVRRAVTFARERGLPVSIKGGGHNVAGLAVTDGGLMLDLSAMRAVSVDPAARTARVQGGALWADVDRETAAFGLATTGGVISHTGIGGLTLGGGVGWLVGKHGMTVDNLRAVDLVTADGEFVTASPEEHPELFWALRGGGGNFGVATSFEFALHPLQGVLAGSVAYPIARAHDMLAFYREFAAATPDELTVYAQIATNASLGMRVAGMAVCWSGDLVEGERVLEPLRRFGTPLIETIQPMPYPAWQRTLDPKYPHGRRYYWKGTLVADLPDPMLDVIVERAADPSLPWLNATIECYRGAMNRVGTTATAFPHRDARYQLVIVGGCDDPADDATAIAWARGLHAATKRFALNGTFLNFNALDGIDRQRRVRAGYGPNWDRLVEIKRRYDPLNIFRENNNIAP
jgi:FAD/FMN-containing dehydrogenase